MDRLFTLSRPIKRLISVLVDSFFIVFAYWLAIFLRFETNVDIFNADYWIVLSFIVPVTIIANINLGLYRAVIRFLGTTAIVAVAISVFISASALAIATLFVDVFMPRSIPIIYSAFLMIFIGGSRLVMRSWASSLNNRKKSNVLIYGAGSSGIQLVNALNQSTEYNPVAFIDDDKGLQKLSINGIKVHHKKNIENLIAKHCVQRILLAVPSASKNQRA